MSFQDFNFHPSILEGIQALGYVKPTPIQAQAIPPIMEGRDVVGLAQTGTGKTAAFVLPILQRLIDGERGSVQALIVSPTRELAEQISDAVNALGSYTGIHGIAVYGGVSIDLQLSRLKMNPEIVVACPGRLIDHLWGGSISLSNLKILVIDEADRMFDMGFQQDIQSIVECIMNRRQTLLFSATMPTEIRRLAEKILNDPVTVKIGQILPAKTVSHALYPVTDGQKTALLKELLKRTKTKSVLIFTRTKQRTERLAQQLNQAGYRVSSLQGNMQQHQRQMALDRFRSGAAKILVATDIAARGIDIEHISHVINYDMPESTDDYIHRIGRTGRVDKTGEAMTLVTGADAGKIRALEKILEAPLERRTLENFDYAKAPARTEGSRGRPASHRPRRSGGSGRKRVLSNSKQP